MRILVTGVAGFIGSHLAERLIDDGHQVVGLDGFVGFYGEREKARNLMRLRDHEHFSFHRMDMRTAALEPTLDGCDAVVNEAAVAGLAPSWTELELYLSCNVLALGRLLSASRSAGVARFVQISTSSVYGTDAVGDETHATRPASPYGVTKLAAEHLVLAHVEAFGFPAIILRYFSIYGPRQRPDMAYHRFIEAMLDRRPITVYDDGEQSRSNTYIDDCVEATVRALERAEIGEVYNVGGGRALTVNQAIATLGELIGIEPVVERASRRPGDQRHTMADIGKARAALGYEPRIEPADGLSRQVEWHRWLRAEPRSGAGSAQDRGGGLPQNSDVKPE